MRRTEIVVTDGNKTRKFKVPHKTGRGFLTLLESLNYQDDVDEFIPAEDIFPDLKDPVKSIGIALRGIRSKFQLTQEQVAQRLGIDQSDVSKMEKGKRPIGKALAKKIQKEFGIDYRRFL
jgi:DNA-binding XRE family transcriptional regulator